MPPSLMTEKSFWISEQNITPLVLDKDFFFKESDAKDLLQTPDKALFPVIRGRKRWR